MIDEMERPERPRVKLVGEDGNVFNLLALCSRALKRAGQADAAKELEGKVFAAGSYDEALGLMMSYCEVE